MAAKLPPEKRRIVRGYRATDAEHARVVKLAKTLDCSLSDAIHAAMKAVDSPLPADPSPGR